MLKMITALLALMMKEEDRKPENISGCIARKGKETVVKFCTI
jgi:hypothetical protein